MPEEETAGSPASEETSATVMGELSSSVEDLRKKIVVLTGQLTEVEGQKKSANKGFNDAIKDIKEEIKMTLELIKESENG